jgi:hypothetical protein
MSIHLTHEQLDTYVLSDGKTIIATVTNHGYLLYTLNMLKSMRPFGLEHKILILCLDRRGAVILEKKGYRVICIDHAISRFCPWNTKGYDQICYLKMELVYRILSFNKNVLLVDGDIVFLQNPMRDILQWRDEPGEVWIQNDAQNDRDTNNLCTGYLYIRSSPLMIELYDCISPQGHNNYQKCAFDNNDQTYFNKYVKPHCKVNALPLEQYPNGKMFYDYLKSVRPEIVMIHFNWVKGHLKMAKMKEHKLWLLTDEEEY